MEVEEVEDSAEAEEAEESITVWAVVAEFDCALLELVGYTT